MTMVLRFLTLQSLMFWQGGFAFYAAVVVPIATDVLESSFEQGRISRLVAPWIDIAGIVCLTMLLVDHCRTGIGRWRMVVWILLVATHGVLLIVRPLLDGMIDWEDGRHRNRSAFRVWHESYLSLLSLQWILVLIAAGQMLRGWRARDLSENLDAAPEKD